MLEDLPWRFRHHLEHWTTLQFVHLVPSVPHPKPPVNPWCGLWTVRTEKLSTQ